MITVGDDSESAHNQNPLVFRSSFMAIFKWTSILCSLVGGTFYLATWFAGNPVDFPITLVLTAIMSAFFALMILAFPVYVYEDRIRCYNYWGIYQVLYFDEIESVTLESVAGLKYLRAANKEDVNIYLPTWMSRNRELYDALEERAGAEHCLVQAFHSFALEGK